MNKYEATLPSGEKVTVYASYAIGAQYKGVAEMARQGVYGVEPDQIKVEVADREQP